MHYNRERNTVYVWSADAYIHICTRTEQILKSQASPLEALSHVIALVVVVHKQ